MRDPVTWAALPSLGRRSSFGARQGTKIFAVFDDWVGLDVYYTRGWLVLCGSVEEQLAPGSKLCVIL